MPSKFSQQYLNQINSLIDDGDIHMAFQVICQNSDPTTRYSDQNRIAKLYSCLDHSQLGLKEVRVAIVATSTVDHIVDIFKLYMAKQGFLANIYLAAFDTMHQTVLSPNSNLYKFKPDVIWLFTNYRDTGLRTLYGCNQAKVDLDIHLAKTKTIRLWHTIQNNCGAYIFQNNSDVPVHRPLGNFEGQVIGSHQSLHRIYNLELARSTIPGVSIIDLDYISSFLGKHHWFDDRFWFYSKNAFTLDAYGLLSAQIAALISAVNGLSRKVLILDLDNTLWGGEIGDDGIEGITIGPGDTIGEAFQAFQEYIVQLKNRGILLAICSKNEEETAKLPFTHRPEMKIGLNDISVFHANWCNKADNIRTISKTLDLGLESFVFVDDSPYERSLIRRELPMVAVPEMPEDPTSYIRILDSARYFETISFSEEDQVRSKMYKDNLQRTSRESNYTDVDGFLRDLNMIATVGSLNTVHLSRITQLINKTNQFHLTNTRYNENQIMELAQHDNSYVLYFKLNDDIGDNGLVSVVVLKHNKQSHQLCIDTWCMSCRVLARGMEEFIDNEVVKFSRSISAKQIIGHYLPSKKNRLVNNLYRSLGFELLSQDVDGKTVWVKRLHSRLLPHKTFITAIYD
jgi:FkbH-like protein